MISVSVYLGDERGLWQKDSIKMRTSKDKTIMDLKTSISEKLQIALDRQRWFIGTAEVLEDQSIKDVFPNNCTENNAYVCIAKNTDPHAIPTKFLDDVAKKNSSDEWECTTCTALNEKAQFSCTVCSTDNPKQPRRALFRQAFLDADRQTPYYSNSTLEECPVCLNEIAPGEGIILRRCTHFFCKECIISTIMNSNEAKVACPSDLDDGKRCGEYLEHVEIKSLLSGEQLQLHWDRVNKATMHKVSQTFQCLTTNCQYYVCYEDREVQFTCELCNIENCINCETQHAPLTCAQHKDEQRRMQLRGKNAQQDIAAEQKMITDGTAMRCPGCACLIVKAGGCYFVRCRQCQMICCWGTKGPRWGPKGRGDNSGGCKCGVNGKRCVPTCPGCSYE